MQLTSLPFPRIRISPWCKTSSSPGSLCRMTGLQDGVSGSCWVNEHLTALCCQLAASPRKLFAGAGHSDTCLLNRLGPWHGAQQSLAVIYKHSHTTPPCSVALQVISCLQIYSVTRWQQWYIIAVLLLHITYLIWAGLAVQPEAHYLHSLKFVYFMRCWWHFEVDCAWRSTWRNSWFSLSG